MSLDTIILTVTFFYLNNMGVLWELSSFDLLMYNFINSNTIGMSVFFNKTYML